MPKRPATGLPAGPALAIGSAVLFGAATPASKLLLASMNPWLLAGILYLGAGIGLTTILWVNPGKRFRIEAPLRARDIPWLLAVSVIGGGVGPTLLMLGLARTTAASASLLLNVEGLATMVFAWLVFGENVDRRLLLGAALILLGAVAVAWTGGGASLDWGGLFVVGACLAWGIDNNLSRKLSAANPMQVAAIRGLVAGATNLIIALTAGVVLPGAVALATGAIVGFFAIGVSLSLFMLALRHLGAARTSAYYSLAPFIGTLIAVALLHEHPSSATLFGGALMAIGVWLHLTEKHEHEHQHGAMAHEHVHTHDAHHQHLHDGSEPPGEPHSHWHQHEPLRHSHMHYPDLHHQHRH